MSYQEFGQKKRLVKNVGDKADGTCYNGGNGECRHGKKRRTIGAEKKTNIAIEVMGRLPLKLNMFENEYI
ncbi:MAG: hypothetical protein PHQ75_04280 [Thermoguttaceae bacterium]|nr:hypothetical protein [Thermoguttaceae bacterium]